MQRNFDAVQRFFGPSAEVDLGEISDDGEKWLLSEQSPTEPGGIFIYDTASHAVTAVAAFHPNLDTHLLSPTQIVDYQSRDGALLWAYVTAKPGGSGPRPMVVLPHGGPEVRDDYGYDSFAQFLAAQGYVVMQPNFRGSGGFGRAFANAGRGQWGLRMQDDITDAVKHMIDAGVADPHRVCIVGASYGGYAALAGAALTPSLYRCAVSIAGVSDLLEVLRTEGNESGRASQTYQYWRYSIGDPGANHDALVATSPARQAARISIPIMLIHGQADHVVPFHQSELMAAALQQAGHPARFIPVPHADHAWNTWQPSSLAQMYRDVADFLAQNLQ